MDLTTNYLGLNLKNPLVPSASPLSYSLDSMKKLEDSGAAAIIMYSLFEEQILHEAAELEHYLAFGTEGYSESLSYFPQLTEYNLEPDEYINLLRKAKESLKIPVIGSLNGVTGGGWVKYASNIQEAGADALELNIFYIPTDPKLTPQNVEDRFVEVIDAVKKSIKIPVAVKLNPFFSSLASFASRLDSIGVNGLVMFNRFYEPDIDIEKLEIKPTVNLSTSSDLTLPLQWVAILYGKLKANLAATGGIHTHEDIIKMLMVGADVTMLCSALLKNGHEYLKQLLDDLQKWMEVHEYESVKQMKGSMSYKSIKDPAAYERANYMKTLRSFKS